MEGAHIKKENVNGRSRFDVIGKGNNLLFWKKCVCVCVCSYA